MRRHRPVPGYTTSVGRLTRSCFRAPRAPHPQLYEAVRNDWMTNRADSWMALQVPYEGVAQALRDCPFPTYIASSKVRGRGEGGGGRGEQSANRRKEILGGSEGRYRVRAGTNAHAECGDHGR